jgi:lipopolysaccharide export system permease protein
MSRILPRYLTRQFLGLFVFSLVGAVLLFIVVDLVENVDQFIDAKAPWYVTFKYYLFFTPSILVLTMPVGTLLSTVFSVGIMAKNSEIVALKALGYSFYQVMRILLILGGMISLLSFFIMETVAIPANLLKEDIKKEYLTKTRGLASSRFRNLFVQEPPDKIIGIDYFNVNKQTAYNVKIETFLGNQLIERIDTDEMVWNGKDWTVRKGYLRRFQDGREQATPISKPVTFHFRFSPRELATAQIKPDEMSFIELWHFIRKVRLFKGEVHRWLTDFHSRIAFPLSNFFIVMLAAPLSYNRRKKSLTIGFGLSLAICFIYFGCIKLGQTLGQNKTLNPFFAAWLGNMLAGLCGLITLKKTRK